jgi:pyruvate/2-oxoglutarate dehydrogenase complex dihydrolipoamide acyltransferase (E2) component
MRTTVQLTLTGDHRVVDGVDLARFLDAFQAQVEELARA